MYVCYIYKCICACVCVFLRATGSFNLVTVPNTACPIGFTDKFLTCSDASTK